MRDPFQISGPISIKHKEDISPPTQLSISYLSLFFQFHVTSQSSLEVGCDMHEMFYAGFHIFYKIPLQHLEIQYRDHFELS